MNVYRSKFFHFPAGRGQSVKRLKQRNPVLLVKKMARPEHMMGIGYQIQHLKQGVRSALLVGIYHQMTPHLSDEDVNDFSHFYREMLIGMDAEAREADAQPKTIAQLRSWIESKKLPEGVKTICLTLVKLMENPEPLDL